MAGRKPRISPDLLSFLKTGMAQVLEIQPGGGYVTSLELATCRHGDVFICDAFSSQYPFGFTVLWELLDFIIKSEPLISRCHPVNT